jgi:hypothetical protein
VLKYHGALHRYIQTEMEFLDISSLGAAYRYVVKIEQKLKQKTRKFGPGNPSRKNPGKGSPNQYQDNQYKHKKRTLERQRKIPGSGATSTADYRSKQSLVAKVKASKSDEDSDSEIEPERGRWIIDAKPSATIASTKI